MAGVHMVDLEHLLMRLVLIKKLTLGRLFVRLAQIFSRIFLTLSLSLHFHFCT
jgi:hypothetical protein